MVSLNPAQGGAQSETTVKWPYRTTVLFLVGPGIVLWAAVITISIHYL
jgi:hypothetical protein